MADVFISYAREDSARADQIARALESMGLDVFWDNEIPPGKTWADYIEDKLSQCKAMVVLWSASSTKSQWVREEARMGRDRGRLIPAMIDSSPAPFGFGEVQGANLSSWRGEANHPDWVRFANAVDAAVRGPGAAPRPAPAAPLSFTAPPVDAAPAENLSPPGYVMKCLRLYFNGMGRARRMEYWSFVLFQFLAVIAAVALDIATSGSSYEGTANAYWFTAIALLGLAIPGLTVAIRRAHDLGVTGWAVFVGAIPYLGWLIVLIAALFPGQPKPNKYGPDPKAA